MILRVIRYFVCFVVVLGLPFSGAAQANTDILIDKSQLFCVKENLRAYQAQDSSPILIILSACPVTDVTDLILMSADNDLFYRNPEQVEGRKANLLRLQPAELECLMQTLLETSSDPIVVKDGKFCGN